MMDNCLYFLQRNGPDFKVLQSRDR